MTSTANDTTNQQPAEAPLTWTSSKVWGAEGLTHQATATINGETWSFTVDSPSKGHWVARAWRDGDFAMYREDRTMKGAKQQAQERANYAATAKRDDAPDVIGALPDGTPVVADHKTMADQRRYVDACGTNDIGPDILKQLDEAAWQAEWQAEWDSRPEGADVSDLIEITPILDSPAAECGCDPVPHREDDGTYSHWAGCPIADEQQAADLTAYGTELAPDVLKKLDPAEAQQLMAELEETFPHLAEWKANVLGSRLKRVGDQMGQVAETMAGSVAPAVVDAVEALAKMSAAVERVQAARDRVQLRKDTCGCRTPLHTMRCGVGGRARVINPAVSA